MRRLSREDYSPACSVVMGQLVAEEKEKLKQAKNNRMPIVGVGHCGKKVVQDYSVKNIKGCPARAEQIYRVLKELS